MAISKKHSDWLDRLVIFRRNEFDMEEAIALCVDYLEHGLGSFADGALRVAHPRTRGTLYNKFNEYLNDNLVLQSQKDWFNTYRSAKRPVTDEQYLEFAAQGLNLGIDKSDIVVALKRSFNWDQVDALRHNMQEDKNMPSYSRSELCDDMNMPNTTLRRWLGIIDPAPPGAECFWKQVDIQEVPGRPVKYVFRDKATRKVLTSSQLEHILEPCSAAAQVEDENLAGIANSIIQIESMIAARSEERTNTHGPKTLKDLKDVLGMNDTNIQDCIDENDAYIEPTPEDDLETTVETDCPATMVINGVVVNFNNIEYFRVAMEVLTK